MAAAKEGIKQKVRGWSHHDSADLYGIDDWGNGYFRISKKGEVTVRLNDEDGGKKDVSLCDLLEGLKERGTTVPVLFRFRDLLRSRIAELNDSFRKAIKEAGYVPGRLPHQGEPAAPGGGGDCGVRHQV